MNHRNQTRSLSTAAVATSSFNSVNTNTTGGGVWAPTSAKRDKLAELTAELKWDKHQRSLNDVATLTEKMDLHLIEGLYVLFGNVDVGNNTNNTQSTFITTVQEEVTQYLQQLERNLSSPYLTQDQYTVHLQQIHDFVAQLKRQHFPASSCLLYLRDFCIYNTSNETTTPSSSSSNTSLQVLKTTELESLAQDIAHPLAQCQLYLQFTLLEACIKLFISSGWNEFMIPSDIEKDRYAAAQTMTPSPSISQDTTTMNHMNVKKLHSALLTHFLQASSCSHRIQALWNLKDRNDDARIEKDDLESFITWSIRPIQDTFQTIVLESLDACPVRLLFPDDKVDVSYPYDLKQEQSYYEHDLWYYVSTGFSRYLTMQEEEEENKRNVSTAPTTTATSIPSSRPLSSSSSSKGLRFKYKHYRNRKEIQRVEKYIKKYLNKTIRYHFDREVELPHRLRCIYAWAEKEHQQGKIESVFIPSSSPMDWIMMNSSSSLASTLLLQQQQGGHEQQRKRYVELEPQISFLEFQSMQKIHFPHLDRIGSELCTSLKEELWIHQGKRRQGVEFRREAMIFLSLVTVLDVIITLS